MNRSQIADQLFERVRVLIENDMLAERVPYGVASFSELHNYVDANEYLIDASHAVIGEDVDVSEWIDVYNVVTERITADLTLGALEFGADINEEHTP